MSISLIQPGETQHSVDALDGFSPIGGNAPSVTHPELTYTYITMSGAADYVAGGYALSAAQLSLPTTVQSAVVNGPSGPPNYPSTGVGAAVSAQYNTSTNKLQLFGANGAELAANAVVGGTWMIVARGY
jgi:hypothetical protein